MPVEALRIDGDDLAFDLLPNIERSFGIELPSDLRHITTVGDLHALILEHAPGTGGEQCGTMIVFHVIRRALTKYGVDPRTGPDFPLARANLRSPRHTREMLATLGLDLPAHVVGGWCEIALVLGLGLTIVAFASGEAMIALLAIASCWAATRLDGGRWAGDWSTLGSLTRATAGLNHHALADRGARHSPDAVWSSLRNLLSGYGIGSRDIARATRLLD